MTHRTILRSAFALFVTLFLSATAQAQLFRAYLDPTGSDANPCTLAAPCRLLPAALAAVASGGEIWMLDSANYNSGPVSITKSVTILAVPGALGSVVAAGGNAIDISAAGVKVALRNLVIVPLLGGDATNGIVMTAGAELTIENCLIANMPNFSSGIRVLAAASVQVANSTIRDNGSVGLDLQLGARATITRTTLSGNDVGVQVSGSLLAGTTTSADIADSTIDGNGNGVWALSVDGEGVVKASVRNSRVVRNTLAGMRAESVFSGTAVTISASNNIVSNNGHGLATAGTGSKVWASGNTVSDNDTGFLNSGGLFESAGNNAVRNNNSDTSGTITPIATK